jgi:hypothetical protein
MIQHPRPVPWHAVLVTAMLGLLIPAGPLPAAQPPKLPEPTENAALYYWKAVGLMQQPQTRDQLDLAQFADGTLRELPPQVFIVRPDVLRWLLNERSVFAALNQASQFKTCAFTLHAPGTPGLDVSHLPRLRALVRRVLGATKACEYADNREGAAIVYADLLTLVRNLDQDRNFTSGFAAAEMLQEIVLSLEGFISREPPVAVADMLAGYFKSAASPVFNPAAYLLEEARANSAWLLAEPERAEEKLSRLYGNASQRPAVEQLMSLDGVRKEQRLRGWAQEYVVRMKDMAEAMQMPFGSATTRLRELDAEREAMRRSPNGGDNPLVPLLVPALSLTYQRFLLAEAQFDMAEILACAAAFRQGTGTWPGAIAEINLFMKRPMAQDPFTGEDFYFRLARDMPAVAARIPKSLAAVPGLLYRIELAPRRKVDLDRATAAIRAIEEARQKSVLDAVPMNP